MPLLSLTLSSPLYLFALAHSPRSPTPLFVHPLIHHLLITSSPSHSPSHHNLIKRRGTKSKRCSHKKYKDDQSTTPLAPFFFILMHLSSVRLRCSPFLLTFYVLFCLLHTTCTSTFPSQPTNTNTKRTPKQSVSESTISLNRTTTLSYLPLVAPASLPFVVVPPLRLFFFLFFLCAHSFFSPS